MNLKITDKKKLFEFLQLFLHSSKKYLPNIQIEVPRRMFNIIETVYIFKLW